MTKEEKAQAYDAALERAKGILCDGNCSDIEAIFPELRESEDERIRKWLIKTIHLIGVDKDICADQETMDKAIAWLEKQKEIPMPNSTELIEMWHKEEAMLKEKDFRGDGWRLAYNAFLDGFAQGMMVKQKEQKKDNPLEDFSKGYNAGYYHGRTDSEQKPDIEICPHSIKSKSYLETGYPIVQKPAEWSEEDKDYYDTIVRKLEVIGDDCGLSNNQIKFLRDHCPSYRSEWSEEDEKMLNEVLNRVTYAFYDQGNEGEIEDDPAFLWLHRLRPSWKPSEEHLSALLAVFNDPNNIGSQTCQLALTDLYEQLKKLM